MLIRAERPEDFAEIADVLRAAFGDSGDGVALLVERTRADGNGVTEGSLVAADGSAIVGYLGLSWVGVEGGARDRILDLGPLAVRPDRHGEGIGRALVEAQLAVVRHLDEPVLMVEGIPELYPRFGFEPAGPLGFTKPHESIPDAAFMVLRLPGYTPDLAGRVVYPAAFDHLPY